MTRPLIVGFMKARNEVLREGNIYRAIKNLKKFTDTIVACDDASVDGTREYLRNRVPKDQRVLVAAHEQDFRKELFWKQRMMEIVHRLQPHFVWWHDADEELEDAGVQNIRRFCEANRTTTPLAWRFHYTQLWRNASWARTDEGFDDGSFVKLWRWSPDLSFNVVDGTHHYQFPQQFAEHVADKDAIPEAPWEVIHWGNFGTNLRWKAIQYHGGLGGVDRHLDFENGSFRALRLGKPRAPRAEADTEPRPAAFTTEEKKKIKSFLNLKALPETFTVVIPTRDRAEYLPVALKSLLDQTYQRWIALVLDDGSTDNTKQVMREWQDRDPRIFYARYPPLGAVWVNERGMDMACEFTEWWTRLGSDDYFMPHKLARDAEALRQGHEVCYGPYRVLRGPNLGETCNQPERPEHIQAALLGDRGFVGSWACIAAKTSLLRRVKHRWGGYCAKNLSRMEDFLVNARMVRFAPFVWRGAVEDSRLLIDPDPNQVNRGRIEHDAVWRVNPKGASSDTGFTANEDVLTREIIQHENGMWQRGEK